MPWFGAVAAVAAQAVGTVSLDRSCDERRG